MQEEKLQQQESSKQQEIGEIQGLAINQEEISALKKTVDEKEFPAFLCTTVKENNPNYLAIIHANDIFCEFFKQSKDQLLSKSFDFLFDDVDVNYSSQDQLEYIRLIKSIKSRENCSIIKKIEFHNQEQPEVSKFKIDFLPIQNENSKKFYSIFSFEKIIDEGEENEFVKSKQDSIKLQNLTLVKNLERALSNEKLLREMSYLIISDRQVKEIAQQISQSLCKLLKTDRCIINALKDGKPSFIVEFCNSKPILQENNNNEASEYIQFQNNFYTKIKNSSEKSTLFIAHDTKTNNSFEKVRGFYEKYSINSQIVALTSFDGQINGGIYILSSQNRDLTVDEMELIELIADQLAIAIDRSNSIEKVMIANHNLLTKTLELKEAVKKEKEMRKMQTEFVALVSHEFKTPLQIIDSTREIISRKLKKLNVGDEVFDTYFARIKSAIKRMTGLIDSTLDLAKMENGTNDIEVHKQEFNFNELIKEIIDRTADLATKRNIKLTVSLCDNSSEINADSKLLDHCFTNIISNAIKYSKENSEVKILSKCNDQKIAIRVIDQGIGIPKDDLQKIGQKFFRAKNTLEVSGTGIGLYLTKYFIELHNGSVKIESELNIGTSFTVILPKK